MVTIKVRATFVEEVLGTASADPDIHRRFVASKAPDAPTTEQEVEALGAQAVEERSTTVFPRAADGTPILWDYQVKGFMKDACGALRRVPGTLSSKLRAYKKEIDGLVFVSPREVAFRAPGGDAASAVGECQRPLRAATAQGERVALAHSETMPAGSWVEFEVTCLRDDMAPLVREWLDYGALRGIGQWRNSGKGRLVWCELDRDGNVIGGNGRDPETEA